jgi:hypothetical protein
MPNYSGVWNLVSQLQAVAAGNWPVPPLSGALAYVFSGESTSDSIQYFNIPSGGVTTSFGTKFYTNSDAYGMSALSNTIYGLLTSHTSPAGNRDKIEYITFATLGSNAAWGTLTQGMSLASACSNSTRGLIGADAFTGPVYNLINYVTLASTGNASSFGQLSADGPQQGSALASTTRAVFAIGFENPAFVPPYYASSAMQYVTIASTGNSTFFGNLSVTRRLAGSGGSSTRGLTMGGYNNSTYSQSAIDYITIASTGNSTTFGNLTVARRPSVTSDSIKAVAVGGDGLNVIDYVTIASTGNATNYGTLSQFSGGAACSNAHGGL